MKPMCTLPFLTVLINDFIASLMFQKHSFPTFLNFLSFFGYGSAKSVQT